MDPNLRKAFDVEDFDEIILRATRFAGTVLRKYYWRGFRPSGGSGEVDSSPDAESAEDFVSEALKRLLEGRRAFNSEKSLLENINSITESLISSAKKSSDRKPLSDYPDPPEEFEEPADPVSTANALQGETGHEVVDAELIEDQKMMFLDIRNSLDGDDDAQAYLDAMKEGFHKPNEIADVTHLSVEDVYEIRRRIKKHVKGLFDVQNFHELKRKLVKG